MGLLKTFTHNHSVTALAVSNNFVYSASGSEVLAWENTPMDANKSSLVYDHNSSEVSAIAVAGETLVTAAKDNAVRLWDVTKKNKPALKILTPGTIYSIKVVGTCLIFGSEEWIKVWDQVSERFLTTLQLASTPKSKDNKVLAMAVLPCSQWRAIPEKIEQKPVDEDS